MPRHASYPLVALIPHLLLTHVGVVAAAQNDKPKSVDVSLFIVTPTAIASVAALGEKAPARGAIFAWLKPVIGAVESQFATATNRRTFVVQVTLHPDRSGEVAVTGRSAPTNDEIGAILK